MDTSPINDRIIAELLQGDEEYEFINMARCGVAGASPDVDVEIALAVERALASDGSGIILYDTRERSSHMNVPTRLTDSPAQNSPCDVTNDEIISRVLQALENEESSDEPCEDVGPPAALGNEDIEEEEEYCPECDLPLGDLYLMDEEANFQRPETPPPAWLTGQVLSVEETSDDELEHCPICRERFSECDTLKQESCSHLFHPTCIDNWRRQQETCPVCRARI